MLWHITNQLKFEPIAFDEYYLLLDSLTLKPLVMEIYALGHF